MPRSGHTSVLTPRAGDNNRRKKPRSQRASLRLATWSNHGGERGVDPHRLRPEISAIAWRSMLGTVISSLGIASDDGRHGTVTTRAQLCTVVADFVFGVPRRSPHGWAGRGSRGERPVVPATRTAHGSAAA